MRKNGKLFYGIMLAVIIAAGCGKATSDEQVISEQNNSINDEEEDMDEIMKESEEGKKRRQEILDSVGGERYLIDYFGFEEGELNGYDCDAFASKWIVSVKDEPSEEFVRRCWEHRREDYKLTGDYLIYGMLQKDSGRKLTKDDNVVKIKMFSQIDNEPGHEVIADVVEGVFYVDDTTPHEMDDNMKEKLEDVTTKYDVESWESIYENYDDSTAYVGWEVRFLLDNGDVCVYSGGGASFSSFPSDIMGIVSCYNDSLESVGLGN